MNKNDKNQKGHEDPQKQHGNDNNHGHKNRGRERIAGESHASNIGYVVLDDIYEW